MAKQSQNSVLIYVSWYAALKDLSLEEKGEILDAIFQYHISGELPNLSPVARIAFQFMKSVFDQNSEKYKAVCERNRKNGNKPKNKKPNEAKEASGFSGIPNKLDNDSDNDSDNDTDIKKLTPENFQLFRQVVKLFDSKFYQEDNWLETYDKLIRIDKYSEKEILDVVAEFRSDGNWWKDSGNFETLLKLRKRNNEGVKFIDVFKMKMNNSIKNGKSTVHEGDITSSARYIEQAG